MSSNLGAGQRRGYEAGRWKIIATMLAVTHGIRKHVYLDTFVVLGSLADNWLWSQSAGSPSARLRVVLAVLG